LIEESLEVTNKWDSFGSISAQQSSKKIEIIDSYFSHAPSLNQNSVDSQADILESSSKREFEISHTDKGAARGGAERSQAPPLAIRILMFIS